MTLGKFLNRSAFQFLHSLSGVHHDTALEGDRETSVNNFMHNI